MKEELHALKDGIICFDEFARRTEHEWRRLAIRIYYRWRTPSDVEVRDITQELMLSAWRASSAWIEAHGPNATGYNKSKSGYVMTLEAYVVWMACREAERWVHTMRNAKRRSAHSPGRYELSWTDYTRGDCEILMDECLVDTQTSETVILGVQALTDVIESLDTEVERIAMYAWISTGSADKAVEYLEADPKRRSALNLWTDGAARRLVNRSIATSAALMQDVA